MKLVPGFHIFHPWLIVEVSEPEEELHVVGDKNMFCLGVSLLHERSCSWSATHLFETYQVR